MGGIINSYTNLRGYAVKGLLIAVEGPDGCGKTTLVEELYQAYTDLGVKVLKCSLFSDEEFNMQVKKHVVNGGGDNLANALLMLSVIHQRYVDVIKPALDDGYLVLVDRWTSSTAIYHNCEGVVLKMIEVTRIAKPDLTLVLTVSDTVIHKRLQARVSVGLDDAADHASLTKISKLNQHYYCLLANTMRYESTLGPMYRIPGICSVSDVTAYISERFGVGALQTYPILVTL